MHSMLEEANKDHRNWINKAEFNDDKATLVMDIKISYDYLNYYHNLKYCACVLKLLKPKSKKY